MKLDELFSLEELKENIQDGYIREQSHPFLPLHILGYSDKAQIEQHWNDVTSNCRGLIYNTETMEIVARPFMKFRNYTEIRIPNWVLNAKPLVSTKVDGSLGILYWNGTNWAVATRGSFDSEQAREASDMLCDYIDTNYPNILMELAHHDKPVTFLVEIIYPQNRIVVNYGDKYALILLGAIDIETGADIPLKQIDWPGDVTDIWEGINDEHEAYQLATSNAFEDQEGVVAVWYRYNKPSFRLKYKHPTYIALHRILTNCTKRTIWHCLANNVKLDEYLQSVPEEFESWVRETADELQTLFIEAYKSAKEEYERIMALMPKPLFGEFDRKAFADLVSQSRHQWSKLAFGFLDDRQDKIKEYIWKELRPEAEKPFFVRQNEEE